MKKFYTLLNGQQVKIVKPGKNCPKVIECPVCKQEAKATPAADVMTYVCPKNHITID